MMTKTTGWGSVGGVNKLLKLYVYERREPTHYSLQSTNNGCECLDERHVSMEKWYNDDPFSIIFYSGFSQALTGPQLLLKYYETFAPLLFFGGYYCFAFGFDFFLQPAGLFLF